MLDVWQRKWKKRGERTVKTRTLNAVLREALPPDSEIDLLTVAAEGHDLNVLRSIDLDLFRPKLIVVEMHRMDLMRTDENAVARHLRTQGYRQIAYDTLNGHFVDARTKRRGLRLT